MPSRQFVESMARCAMIATSAGSRGAAKHAKTCARSAAITSSGVASGASTMILTPGRTARISLEQGEVRAKTVVRGLVSTRS